MAAKLVPIWLHSEPDLKTGVLAENAILAVVKGRRSGFEESGGELTKGVQSNQKRRSLIFLVRRRR
jgi:hypothetical protein